MEVIVEPKVGYTLGEETTIKIGRRDPKNFQVGFWSLAEAKSLYEHLAQLKLRGII